MKLIDYLSDEYYPSPLNEEGGSAPLPKRISAAAERARQLRLAAFASTREVLARTNRDTSVVDPATGKRTEHPEVVADQLAANEQRRQTQLSKQPEKPTLPKETKPAQETTSSLEVPETPVVPKPASDLPSSRSERFKAYLGKIGNPALRKKYTEQFEISSPGQQDIILANFEKNKEEAATYSSKEYKRQAGLHRQAAPSPEPTSTFSAAASGATLPPEIVGLKRDDRSNAPGEGDLSNISKNETRLLRDAETGRARAGSGVTTKRSITYRTAGDALRGLLQHNEPGQRIHLGDVSDELARERQKEIYKSILLDTGKRKIYSPDQHSAVKYLQSINYFGESLSFVDILKKLWL